MSKKIIDRLHGLPFVLIILILLVRYLDLFPVPFWLLGVIISWGAITFFMEAMRQQKEKA
ncbi:hypothetical protein [Algoriphagus sp. A40]|uniref:hypothetical protein n=1 Tax=Algoriphagus sp. A40 TaxID=1945863 RepID=UPI000987556E|nr:hypothetical protein [Algoriphagus sp. A40]OOG68753.1 hypothetical protein B0E43_22005 [Algoriphagus sp. A40]